MKNCINCGAPMEDTMSFCPECGTKNAPQYYSGQQPIQDSFLKYRGLSYSDIESGNKLEFTSSGIHIFHEKGTKRFQFDKTIPYSDILDVNFQQPTGMKSGYLSIITATEGITGNAKRQQLLFDHNTVLFTKKNEEIVNTIYQALKDISLSSTVPHTTPAIPGYGATPRYASTGSATLPNSSTKRQKPLGCLIPLIFVLVIFSITMIAIPKSNDSTSSVENSVSHSDSQTTTTNLSDVQKWYEGQMPKISQSLIDYSKSVKGLSNMNVDESKFLFGENSSWYDCHYTIYFTCKVNGDRCTGEARAFLKYKDNTPEWFHFEIFRDSDWSTIVEHYDESYEKVIEDYYKQLATTYK